MKRTVAAFLLAGAAATMLAACGEASSATETRAVISGVVKVRSCHIAVERRQVADMAGRPSLKLSCGN
jgi:hypothetical protein